MVKDLASRVRRLYNHLEKSAEDIRNEDRHGWSASDDAKLSVYYKMRSKMRDYFPELKLKKNTVDEYPTI